MNEVQHFRDQENEAFGRFLIESISASMGIDPDPKRIDRAVYRGTSCGAWVRFDEKGVMVGTIVEGSDAEFSKRIDLTGIDTDEAGAALLCKRFWEALDDAEEFASEQWAERDAEDETGSK